MPPGSGEDCGLRGSTRAVTSAAATAAAQVARREDLTHVILMCPAVNAIDLSALEALEEVNTRLRENDVTLHLSEVKGPVMDALQRSDFLNHLSGEIFLSHHHAVMALRVRETADPALT